MNKYEAPYCEVDTLLLEPILVGGSVEKWGMDDVNPFRSRSYDRMEEGDYEE